jgi:hypothetical protein
LPQPAFENSCIQLPWEHEVSKLQTIPGGMIQEPVPSSTIVNEHHQNDADPAEERKGPFESTGSQFLVLLKGFHHSIDNQLKDDGDVVSLLGRPLAILPKQDSQCTFLLKAESITRP